MRILLADDHQMFIEGISYILGEAGCEVMGIAKTGKEVLKFFNSNAAPPDLIILDIEMPEMDGVQVASEIKKLSNDTKIIVLTMHAEPEFIRQMLTINVDGYLLKDAGKERLLEAIEAIRAGRKFFEDKVTESIFASFSQPRTSSQLTEREVEIIRLIADQKTTSQMAKELFLSKHTIETHRKNILLKLGLKNSAGLVKYAMRNGLVE